MIAYCHCCFGKVPKSRYLFRVWGTRRRVLGEEVPFYFQFIDLFDLFLVFCDRVSRSPGWPGTHYVVSDDFEHLILPPPFLKCLDYRRAILCSAQISFNYIFIRLFCVSVCVRASTYAMEPCDQITWMSWFSPSAFWVSWDQTQVLRFGSRASLMAEPSFWLLKVVCDHLQHYANINWLGWWSPQGLVGRSELCSLVCVNGNCDRVNKSTGQVAPTAVEAYFRKKQRRKSFWEPVCLVYLLDVSSPPQTCWTKQEPDAQAMRRDPCST